MAQNLCGGSWPLWKAKFGKNSESSPFVWNQAVVWPEWGFHPGQSEQDECYKAKEKKWILNFVMISTFV